MIVSRVFSRIARNGCNQIRSFASSPSSLPRQGPISILSQEWVTCQKPQPLHNSFLAQSMLQRSWMSSSASPQPNQKENNQFTGGQGTTADKENTPQEISQDDSESVNKNVDGKSSDHKADDSGSTSKSKLSESQSVKKRRPGTKRTAFSDSDAEEDLSVDDLVKLVQEKEALVKEKQEEVAKMKDKVLRSYAEMENVIERTKRESENSKKFAIQSFAKSLLDVADNLGRASSVVKDSFSKIDQSKDSVGVIPLLKTLLEGVEMTEKQLAEVFKKFGMEKFDPINEQFDPNRHLAVFQLPDASKPPGTVAAVLKAGYMLHDRIIRPAEVGVTQALTEEADQTSDA